MSERDDDELDDASMKSMRAVWLSMRDEDPPAAGMSALMAAAASKAEQMRPQASWWQRVVAQLRRPPALAFATVLVLIGGAVLVTRSQDDKKVESLREEETRSAQPMIQPTMERPSATIVDEAKPADPPPPEDVVAKPPEVKAQLDAKVDAKPKHNSSPSRPEGARDRAGKNEPTRYDRFEDGDTPKSGFAEGQTKDTGTGTLQTPAPGGGPGADAPVIVTPTAPPPTEAPADPKKPQPPRGGETVTTDSTASSVPPNEQLAKQAESAAARGDCAAVRAIVGRLKQQNEAFYKARLGKNAAVTKCL